LKIIFLQITGDFKMNIGKFREYREKNFEASQWSEMIRDKRKRPQIPTVQIFKSVLEMPVFGQKTLLELDGFLRTPEARSWHGSNRTMVASDTTVERVTEGMDRGSVQRVGYQVIDQGDGQALWDLKLPSGKKLRFGIVDGHYAGGIWTSVLGGKWPIRWSRRFPALSGPRPRAWSQSPGTEASVC